MNEFRRSLEIAASRAERYDRNSRAADDITFLANKYCEAYDAGDEDGKSTYISALMLKFWDNVGRMQETCRTANFGEYDDFGMQLFKCIQVACEMRAWQPTSSYYKSPTTAKACINQVIASRGAPEIMYEANRDISKIHAAGNLAYLDSPLDGTDAESGTFGDTIESLDDSVEATNMKLGMKMLVESYVKRNKVVEAIVLDTILSSDCVRQTSKKESYVGYDDEGNEVEKTYTKYSSEFWDYQAVKALKGLPAGYVSSFSRKYGANEAVIQAAYNAIGSASSTKLYKYLNGTKELLRTERAAGRI